MLVYTGHLTFTPRFDLDAPLAQLQQVLADAIQGCDALYASGHLILTNRAVSGWSR
jgi:hypothetical protein